MVVQHNLRAMNSNRMLGLTASVQSKSTEKLSSGYKINRAADDAAGLSISEKMRKQIRGLSQASLNAQDGISAVQTAEGALNEVQDMLQRMNELAVKAANGTMSEDDRGYIQDEINQLVTEIDRVAETTKFNETYLLKGNGTSANTDVAPVGLTGTPVQATKGTYVTAAFSGTPADNKDAKYEVEYVDKDGVVQKKEVEFKSVNGNLANSVNALVDALNAESDLTDLFTITNSSNGVSFVAKEAGADKGRILGVKFTAGTTAMAGGNTLATNTAGADASTTYDVSGLVDGAGDSITVNGKTYKYHANPHADDREYSDFNGLKALLAKDGVIVGGVASTAATFKVEESYLDFNLHVGADSSDENQISVRINAMDASSLGLKTGSMTVDDEKMETLLVNGSGDMNARAAIDTITDAIQKVSTQRSALGAVQNRLEHTIANLDNVVENTTAAESQIRDTDMATEMVKYSNNNILAQAGQAMLAQANQANQGVLSLLG